MQASSRRLCLVATMLVGASAVAVPNALLSSASAATRVTAWSAPKAIDNRPPFQVGEPVTQISCPTKSFCAGAGYGDIETTRDPGATAGPASGWQIINVDGSYPTTPSDPTINSISCPSARLCVAVDSNGNVLTSTSPSGGAGAWSVTSEDRGEFYLSVSCPSSGLCVAVGRGPGGLKTLTSTDPAKGAKAKWVAKVQSSFGDEGPNAVTCSGPSLCVAVGSNNSGISTTWTTTHPTEGAKAKWTANVVGSTVGSDFLTASCVGTSLCVAAGNHGQVATVTNPTHGATATWHTSSLVVDGIASVDCPSASLCLAIDIDGNVLTSTNPTNASPAWGEKTGVSIEGETLSCAGATFCVTTSQSSQLSTTGPASGAAAVWKTTGYIASSSLVGVSCPSKSFCAAADGAGNVSTSTDAGSKHPKWSTHNVDSAIATNPGGSYGLEDISCPSAKLCVAVDSVGNVLDSTDPGAASPTWAIAKVDNEGGLVALSCPSTRRCIAVDFAGDAVVSTDPTGGLTAWKVTNIHGGLPVHYTSVSCPSTRQCFAGDEGGEVTTINLTSTGTIAKTTTAGIDLGINSLDGMSCPKASLCVAADSAGNVEVSKKPSGPSSAWKRIKVDRVGASTPAHALDDVSCASASYCVAVDAVGNAVSSRTPSGKASSWHSVHVDDVTALDAVSCPSTSQCVAVDEDGNAMVGHEVKASIAIAPSKLPRGKVGSAYHEKLSAAGGKTPYKWKKTAGSLPSGLHLSPAGKISGKPHSAGKSTFTVEVKDASKPSLHARKKYSLVVKKRH